LSKDREPSQSKQFDHKEFAKKLNINKADNQNFYILVFSLQHAYFEIKSIIDTLEQLAHHESAVMFLGLGFLPRKKKLSYKGLSTAGTKTNRVKVSEGHFVDAQDGRVLMFRGKAYPNQTTIAKPNMTFVHKTLPAGSQLI
jgi:hypothetical protein